MFAYGKHNLPSDTVGHIWIFTEGRKVNYNTIISRYFAPFRKQYSPYYTVTTQVVYAVNSLYYYSWDSVDVLKQSKEFKYKKHSNKIFI